MAFSHGAILTIDEVNLENDTVTVTTRACVVCGKNTTMTVNKGQFERWQHNEHIQEAFHDMPVGDREVLISGTHDECFNELFPPEGSE